MDNRRFSGLSSAFLHILAMMLMLCDHLWGTIVPGNDWLTWIGRITFPLYAFLIVEGYLHTRSLRRYAMRLLVLALFSEIPFDLMLTGAVFYPFHQNVLWTLLLGLGLMHCNELAAKKQRLWLRLLTAAGTVLLAYVLGYAAMVDYYGAGILTVLTFYFLRKKTWWSFAAQLAVLYYLNVEMLGGYYQEFSLLGTTLTVHMQGMALLALVPIWLYRGRQGYHSKWFQTFCYGFYPAHMLLLFLIKTVLL